MEPYQWNQEDFFDRNWTSTSGLVKPSTSIKNYWAAPNAQIKDKIQSYQRWSNDTLEDLQWNQNELTQLTKGLANEENRSMDFTHLSGAQTRALLYTRDKLIKSYKSGIRKRNVFKKNLKYDRMKYEMKIKGFKRDFPNYRKN